MSSYIITGTECTKILRDALVLYIQLLSAEHQDGVDWLYEMYKAGYL